MQGDLDRAAQEACAFQHEYRLVMPDGSIKHVQSIGHPRIDGENGALEFVGTIMDITERKQAEEALRKSQSELALASRLSTIGELAASIIHEINQPLAAVIGNAEGCLRWLDRAQPDIAEARDSIKRLVRDGRRAADVVKGLTALVRRSGLEVADVDINDAISEVLVLLRGEMDRHAILLRLALGNSIMPVRGDRVQLQQVIANLVRNGIEAMNAIEDRPRILRVISELTKTGQALVSIEDVGTGLDPEAGNRIFEPLYTTKVSGMGMGLSVCRSIIEAHHGRLYASPNSPYGAVFQFTVPSGSKATDDLSEPS